MPTKRAVALPSPLCQKHLSCPSHTQNAQLGIGHLRSTASRKRNRQRSLASLPAKARSRATGARPQEAVANRDMPTKRAVALPSPLCQKHLSCPSHTQNAQLGIGHLRSTASRRRNRQRSLASLPAKARSKATGARPQEALANRDMPTKRAVALPSPLCQKHLSCPSHTQNAQLGIGHLRSTASRRRNRQRSLASLPAKARSKATGARPHLYSTQLNCGRQHKNTCRTQRP